MDARRPLAGWLCGAALAVVQTCAPAAVPALAQVHSAPGVAVGDTAAPAGDARTAGALHDALSHELAQGGALRLARTAHEARWVVGGAVTQLARTTAPEGVEVRCAVSLVVADARGGAVRVMLQGRASARGDDAQAMESAALAAAVRSALRPLGGALLAMR